jgi:protein-S-isoprenylcysteine O-methyltransferase Ste14
MNAGLLLRGIGMVVALTAVLLVLGGRLSYWQAWLFGLVNVGLVIAVSFWLADQAGQIRDRMRPGPATKAWDRVLMAVFFPLSLAVPAVAALDAGRFGWSPPFHSSIHLVGYAVYVGSAWFHLGSIRINRFYTSTVSIEPEAGHHVVDSGPYRFVRHPGYTGIILMEAAIAVVLGSVWALIPATSVAALLVARTVLEDGALMAELPGYREYAAKVRYRLLPGVW